MIYKLTGEFQYRNSRGFFGQPKQILQVELTDRIDNEGHHLMDGFVDATPEMLVDLWKIVEDVRISPIRALVDNNENAKDEYLNEWADFNLVEITAKNMLETLEKSRDKGRYGWWTDYCTIGELKKSLSRHVRKGDMRDVINIAAMIYVKENLDEY